MLWATQGKFQTLKLLFFQILSFSFVFTPITRLVKFPSSTKLHSSHLSPSPPTLGSSAFLSGIISSLVFHYPHLLLSQSIFHTTARMIFSEQIWSCQSPTQSPSLILPAALSLSQSHLMSSLLSLCGSNHTASLLLPGRNIIPLISKHLHLLHVLLHLLESFSSTLRQVTSYPLRF